MYRKPRPGRTGDEVLKWAHTRRAKSVEMRQVTTTPDGIMQVRKLEGGLPPRIACDLMDPVR